jgi:hypothetical protein
VTLSPNRTLLASLGAVAASGAALPWVGGYGTVLFQVVVLGAAYVLDKLTSESYVDHHHGVLWTLAFLLNVVLFAIPATLLWALTRRWPQLATFMLVSLCALYLASLFVLFPATDGP